jgi:hypothetical protein
MSDPVKRLRFLRAVAPLANIWGDGRRGWGRRASGLVLAVAAAAALTTFLYSGAAAHPAPPSPPSAEAAAAPLKPAGDVWLVEQNAASEVYSNGLQIDTAFAAGGAPREYLAFPVSGDGAPERRSELAGIVFHGTESQQIPFEAGRNETLKKLGESLLDYVRRRRCYNFVIDRFGRVHRVVAENAVAEHAGYSAWADGRWLYLNLNQSFLGVAFEARTAPSEQEVLMTAAQARAAAMLTEMLRARYHIPASNCVTHGQVSVNPSNLRIGYHVDWAAGFPFHELGLPDNYAVPLPAIWRLGFECDPALRRAATGLRTGVEAAEALLARQAAAAGESPAKWRKHLRQQYRQRLAAVRHGGA